MGRASVAVFDSRAESGAQISSLRRQLGYGRRFRPGRTLGLLALLVVGAWILLSFGRTITEMNIASAREQVLLRETAALSAQVAANHRELDLIQTDGFQALQARAFGSGTPREIGFSLAAGAPEAPGITLLGGAGDNSTPQSPLDAWLRLLFGD